MKTETKSIIQILSGDNSFFIPPFQRAYAWGANEIDRFYNDILKIIDSHLNEKVNENDKQEHFFGTIVIKAENTGFGTKYIVVDGQQRLTTTLLFLIALRDFTDDEKGKNKINNKYLCNEDSEFPDKIKLKQVTKDWKSYRALINNKKDEASGQVKIAYERFCRLIKTNNRTLTDYIIALGRLNIAVIFLDERPSKGEDPQIIFETLNSLGKPLTLADLIRNYVLLKLRSDNQTKIYDDIWYPKIEKVFGDETSKFFRDFLQLKKSESIKVISDNNTKEIYQIFKDYIEQNYLDSKAFVDDIVDYVDPYLWIITDKNNEVISENKDQDNVIKELLRNIFHDIKSDSFKSFVLGLLYFYRNGRVSDDDLIKNLSIVRTYLIRRRVLGLTQAENKNIPIQCKYLNKIVSQELSLWKILSTMFYKMRLPNDNEIREGLVSKNFYEGLKTYGKFILGKIEEFNSKVAVDFRDKKITIEHIMPQSLTSDWEKELGDEFKDVHNNFLHNIGNLILTEFNSEIGNKSFEYKKNKLKESNLNYRFAIIELQNWNKTNILQHQNKMIDDFLKVFYLPEDLRNNSNWQTKTEIDNGFIEISPLDFQEDDIKGTKPAILRIEGQEIKIKTWQDAYLRFLYYIQSNENYDFQILEDNQQQLFGKDDAIICAEKLFLLDGEDMKKYKTLDGKFWDKNEELTNSTKYYHINCSASTCVNRIANVMQQYGIDNVIISCK